MVILLALMLLAVVLPASWVAWLLICALLGPPWALAWLALMLALTLGRVAGMRPQRRLERVERDRAATRRLS